MTLTVITRAATGRLTTLENACLDLGRTLGTAADRRIDRFIEAASADAARVCQRTFGRQIYRERLLSMPAAGVFLSAGPVNRIVSVSIDGGAAYALGEYLIADGRLLLSHAGYSGIGDGSAYNLWRALQPALVVTYEAGWLLPGEEVGDDFTGDTPLPADIERAVIQLVGVAMSESGRDPTVKQETVEGIGSKTFYVPGASAMLPHPGAEAALMQHRRMVLV